MDDLEEIITAFELDSVERIRRCFEKGVNPNQVVNSKPLIHSLINLYTRGPSFKHCIQIFVDYGLEFDDPVLLSVLLDDAPRLDSQLVLSKDALVKKYSFDCTFTPLYEVSLT